MALTAPPDAPRARIIDGRGDRQYVVMLGVPPPSQNARVVGCLDAPPAEDNLQVYVLEHPGEGLVSGPHFHPVDQYQVFVHGGGHLGKRAIGEITVHYADAYTPYGPMVAGDQGMSVYTIRATPTVEGY